MPRTSVVWFQERCWLWSLTTAGPAKDRESPSPGGCCRSRRLLWLLSAFSRRRSIFDDPLPAVLSSAGRKPPRSQRTRNLSLLREGDERCAGSFRRRRERRRRDATSTARCKSLETAPQLDPKADELRERLKALLIKAKELTRSCYSFADAGQKATRASRTDDRSSSPGARSTITG